MEESSLVLQPLDSSEFVSTLRSFRRMLSCMGPEGGIKILISGAGYTTYTSSSSRLLNNIILSNPVCLFINQIIKSQINVYHDHGLYTGILITSLLENILSRGSDMSVSKVTEIIQKLSSVLKSLLESSSIKLEIDFSTVNQILPLIKSIISSKPMCGLTKNDIQNLQLNVVKGFLQTVDKTLGEVFVECIEASEMKSQVLPGILYQVNCDNQSTILAEKCNKCGLTLFLFNMMLTNDKNTKISEKRSITLEECKNNYSVVEETLNLFEQLKELNIDIVACQKVVHPRIQLYLQRKGILLLDRLGTDLTIGVEKLSDATPIPSIKYCPRDIDSVRTLVGSVEALRLIECGQKKYILLERRSSNIATLISPAPNEEAAIELKVVIKQSLNALRLLMMSPAVVPGAGCMEMCLAVRLQDQAVSASNSYNCTMRQLESFISWLQMALLSAAGFSTADSSLTVDSIFGHAWKSEREACCCGLISTGMVQDGKGIWLEVFSNNEIQLLKNITLLSAMSSFPLSLKEECVVDTFQSKQNAIKLSLESCVNMLGIGMIVYKSPNV